MIGKSFLKTFPASDGDFCCFVTAVPSRRYFGTNAGGLLISVDTLVNNMQHDTSQNKHQIQAAHNRTMRRYIQTSRIMHLSLTASATESNLSLQCHLWWAMKSRWHEMDEPWKVDDTRYNNRATGAGTNATERCHCPYKRNTGTIVLWLLVFSSSVSGSLWNYTYVCGDLDLVLLVVKLKAQVK